MTQRTQYARKTLRTQHTLHNHRTRTRLLATTPAATFAADLALRGTEGHDPWRAFTILPQPLIKRRESADALFDASVDPPHAVGKDRLLVLRVGRIDDVVGRLDRVV